MPAQKTMPSSSLPRVAPVVLFRPPSFPIKELNWHWRVWRARSQAVSEHLLPFWPFPFLLGSLCSPQEGRWWMTGLSAVERKPVMCGQSLPPNLWDSADYLELLLPNLQGWAFSDVAPCGGEIAQEKVKWLRLLCCQARWAKRLKTFPQFSY